MQHVCTGNNTVSAVSVLPLIDLNLSDINCIFSTLVFIQQQAEKLSITTPCVTFDQPLWVKAVDIILANRMNIVCRLGGFHTIMSFLGSIGMVMAGSGISDAFETCYGSSTVQQMLSGKQVSRAVRGHLLLASALRLKLLQFILPSRSTSHDIPLDLPDRLTEPDIQLLHDAY